MQCTVIAVLITAARGQQAESVENVFHVHTSDHVYRASEGNKKNKLGSDLRIPMGTVVQ